MKKIPTLFQRTDNRRHVTREVTPGCEWVLNGEGEATRKWDGTCVKISHNGPMLSVWVRREVRPGKQRPYGFVLEQHDDITGKDFGWEGYGASGFAKYIDEALGGLLEPADWPEGTYELCGPKINGNPEGLDGHVLIPHGKAFIDAPRTFDGLRDYLLAAEPMEGIVWHHPDGRRAKLKRRDFA